MCYRNNVYDKPYGHINYVSYATKTIILALQVFRVFGLEIDIWLVGIQIQNGGGAGISSVNRCPQLIAAFSGRGSSPGHIVDGNLICLLTDSYKVTSQACENNIVSKFGNLK